MNRLERVSEYLQINPDKLEKLGVYDGYVNIDSDVYIHPKLLVESNIQEFKNSESKILSYFKRTIELLKSSKGKESNDSFWKIVEKHFHFPEPNGVGLGNSINSINGNGLTGKTAQSALVKLKEVVDGGVTDPYVFQLLSLIQENIGVDRISDMIINIIYDDLLHYTQNILKQLNISELESITYKGKNYMIKKRPNGKNLILVPKVIVSDIPSCADYGDVQDVIDENNRVKECIFEMFGKANMQAYNIKKEDILDFMIKNNIVNEVLQNAKNKSAMPYDFEIDTNGIHIPVEKTKEIFFQNPDDLILKVSQSKTLFDIVGELIDQFKFIIECKGLNEELYHVAETKKGIKRKVPRTEVTSHRLFIAILESLAQVYDVDYTYEPKSGNGEVDFRFVRGREKVLVEFKLNYHSQLVHGYKVQLDEYMKREKCKQAYYVIIKVDDNKNLDKFDEELKTRDAFRKVINIDGMLKLPPSQIAEN